MLILGVPILDTVFSFVRRMVHRQRWHQADAGHLHHRLMRLGHGPRRTVVILWAWTALLSGVALVPTYSPRAGATRSVPFVVAALALLLLAWFHPGIRLAGGSATSGPAHPTGHPGEDVVDLAERRRQRA